MDVRPHPDLSQVLPQPLVRRLAANPALGAGLAVPDAAHGEDFLVEIERRPAVEPGDAGFALQQAKAAAARVRGALDAGAATPASLPKTKPAAVTEPPDAPEPGASAAALAANAHRVAPARAQDLLFGPGAS
jgi:hypothetical protein